MPIPEIVKLRDDFNRAHGTDIWLHSDCVQAFGKIPIDLARSYLGVDMISLSAHKIHGPKGMGALYVRKGLHLPAFLLGGGTGTASALRYGEYTWHHRFWEGSGAGNAEF